MPLDIGSDGGPASSWSGHHHRPIGILVRKDWRTAIREQDSRLTSHWNETISSVGICAKSGEGIGEVDELVLEESIRGWICRAATKFQQTTAQEPALELKILDEALSDRVRLDEGQCYSSRRRECAKQEE